VAVAGGKLISAATLRAALNDRKPWHFAFSITAGSWRWRSIQLRIVGLGFAAIGFVHLIGGAYGFITDLRTPRSDESPAMNLIFVGSGLVGLAIGQWLLRRKPYRPDLGDIHSLLGKAEGYTTDYIAERKRMRRTWWTGDSLPPPLDRDA